MKSLVTVVLPFYNAASTLSDAIDSIINQSYPTIELILINNNSTDGSQNIAQKYRSGFKNIRLLNEYTQGVAHAANRGMNAAKGDFIARMDADDISNPNRIKTQLKFLTESNADICASRVEVNKTHSGFHHFINWSNSILTSDTIYNNRFVEFPMVNPTILMSRECWESVGPYKDGEFPEDYEWFLRALHSDKKCIKVDQQLLFWRDSKSRLTRSSKNFSQDAFFRIKTVYVTRELKARGIRRVWIWGAGKVARKQSNLLKENNIEIEGYIDIKEAKTQSEYTCVHFQSVDIEKHPFILSYVTNRNKRDEIKAFLESKGHLENNNFILMG